MFYVHLKVQLDLDPVEDRHVAAWFYDHKPLMQSKWVLLISLEIILL